MTPNPETQRGCSRRERIVCLTEETVETLYLLGEQDRIVGISGYVVRPPQARREKPRVSAFTSADIPKILALKPDLVLTFSDLQADIAATLIKHGVRRSRLQPAHHRRNPRHDPHCSARWSAPPIAPHCSRAISPPAIATQRGSARRCLPRRPKVYFEEWDDPMISGIAWVSELIEIAGGLDVFADLARPQSRPRIAS